MAHCFGHNLNLAVMKAVNIDRVQQAVKKCHSLIEVFSRSWKKSRDLCQKQEDLALPKHKLIADVSTRWGSVLGVTRYLCNALRNIITFVVTK